MNQSGLIEAPVAIFVVLLNLALGLTVLAQSRQRRKAVPLFFFSVFVASWVGAAFFSEVVAGPLEKTILSRVTYGSVEAASIALLFFVSQFFSGKKIRLLPWINAGLAVGVIAITLATDYVVQGIQFNSTGSFDVVAGTIAWLFYVHMAIDVLLITGMLIVAAVRAEPHERRQFTILFFGVGFFLVANVVFNVFLRGVTGDDALYRFGNYSSFVLVAAFAFSILRRELLHVKIIATQLLTTILVLLLFSRIFFSKETGEIILQAGIFLLAAFLGLLLVRSVIKEVQRREEIERLNRQLADFLRFGVHELRAPLGGIRGYTSMALEGSFGKLEGKLERTMRIIHAQIDHLLLLVETFLDANRARTGNLEVVLEASDLAPIVKQTTDAQRVAAELKGLKLLVDLPADLPKVTIDPRKFMVILGNLLSNGIKYTQKGTVMLRARRHGDKVKIEVADTGIGIPKDVLPHLFTTFERGTNQAKRMATGSGIGLYLSKKLTLAMHGTIDVTSPGPDKGTVSSVTVDVAPKA